MPLHEYQCDVCERRFEKIQRFSDPPVEICPTCGGHVHKLISSPAFHLKGTGWYATDYAKKDGGGTPSDGSEPATGGADKDASAKKDTATGDAPAATASSESASSAAPAKSQKKPSD